MRNILFARSVDSIYVKSLESYGLNILMVDFLKIDLLEVPSFDVEQNSAFIFTSSNGVDGYKLWMKKSRFSRCNEYVAFSTSGNTKKLVDQIGFKEAHCAKDSNRLADLITEMNSLIPKSVYYHFTCKNRLNVLDQRLRGAQIELEIKEVYRKEILEKKIDFDYDSVVFYSPSQIEGFLANNSLNIYMPVFCIGNTTGDAARQAGFQYVSIASEPTTQSILELITSNFKQTE